MLVFIPHKNYGYYFHLFFPITFWRLCYFFFDNMTQIYTDIVFTHLIIFSDFRPEPVFLNLYPRVIFELFYSFLRAIFELGQKL